MPVTNPRKWCSIHGFYDCPVCKGEPVEWVIPVINDRTGQQTGTLTVTEQGDAVVIGQVNWPITASDRANVEYIEVIHETPTPVVTVDAPLAIHEPGDPSLAARLQSVIPSAFERMMQVPRWRDAAAKGRKAHEQALRLVEEKGITYAEAIKLALE